MAAVCQLRSGNTHPFGIMKGFVPLGSGEEQIYRQMREAIPMLDAAVAKMVRLCGGFQVKCRDKESQNRLNDFLKIMPCGRGQMGIESFLSGYLDRLLTYGRAVGALYPWPQVMEGDDEPPSAEHYEQIPDGKCI